MTLQEILIVAFSIVGLFDAGYISYHVIKNTDVACPIFPKEWCLKVQYSPQSKTFGIPNGFLGFLLYASVLVLGLLFAEGRVPLLFVQIPIAIGFLFSLYFLYVQAFVLRAFCLWCLISATNFTVMTVAAFLLR